MRHVVPHGLSPSQARAVAERAFAHYRERFAAYEPQLTWLSDTSAKATFNARSIELGGTVELLAHGIAFDLDVPLVLLIFRSRAIAIVDREVRRWCAEAEAADAAND